MSQTHFEYSKGFLWTRVGLLLKIHEGRHRKCHWRRLYGWSLQKGLMIFFEKNKTKQKKTPGPLLSCDLCRREGQDMDTDINIMWGHFNSPREKLCSLASQFTPATVQQLSRQKLNLKRCPWWWLPMLGRASIAVIDLWVTDRPQADMLRWLSNALCQARFKRNTGGWGQAWSTGACDRVKD